MSLGLTPTQTDVFTTTTGFCESRVSPDSIYGLLHRECFRLFPDEMFADLFAASGRVRREVEVRGRWLVVRLPGLRAHGAGRYARPASGLRASGQDLRGGARDGEGGGSGRPPAGVGLDVVV